MIDRHRCRHYKCAHQYNIEGSRSQALDTDRLTSRDNITTDGKYDDGMAI